MLPDAKDLLTRRADRTEDISAAARQSRSSSSIRSNRAGIWRISAWCELALPESVPPPRLVIGFGKDRRTVDAVHVQDETVVYRYWLTVAEGDKLVHVSLAPGQAENANFVKPKEAAANVSGDKRYGNDFGLHVDSMVVRGPVTLKKDQLPESHRRILICNPDYGDQSRLDCARAGDHQVRRAGVSEARAARGSRTRLARSFDSPTTAARATNGLCSSPFRRCSLRRSFLFLVEPEETRDRSPVD